MRYTPLSEEAANRCFPKGEYDAVVVSAVEKTSKKGNDMIEVLLTVYGPGTEMEVRDWLVSTDGGQAKIQRFCKSADLWETYQSGELTADSCEGLNVTVKLGIEQNDDYPPRNKIVDYMPRKLTVAAAEPEKPGRLLGVAPSSVRAQPREDMTKPPTEDEIPF